MSGREGVSPKIRGPKVPPAGGSALPPGRPGFLETAVADAMPGFRKAVQKAVADALKPPPPGMVRISISVTVAEAFLEDEVALGAYLVRQAKRQLQRGAL